MKNSLALVFLLYIGSALAQPVPSSCSGTDSVVQKYRTDSYRMAVRRVHHIGSAYKDTVNVDATIRGMYHRALIAVYNATALPARDTVVKMLNIHTRPEPGLTTINIKAPGALQWMNKLLYSITPTGDASVDYLMSKYKLQPIGYFQSTNYDLAILRSDSSLNLYALAKAFESISGVIDAEEPTTFNDEKEITDTVNANFTGLTYSFGWGSCENGCDMRAFWKFRIYNDCSVEYMGSSGDALFTSITLHSPDLDLVKVFPNPAKDFIKLEVPRNNRSIVSFEIRDPLGKLRLKDEVHNSSEIRLNGLAHGVYFIHWKNTQAAGTIKFIKE